MRNSALSEWRQLVHNCLPMFRSTDNLRKIQTTDNLFLLDLARTALLVGGVIASMAAAWWGARRSIQRARRSDRPISRRNRAAQMRLLLGEAIVGNPREAILEIFGPPRSSARFVGTAPTLSPNAAYLHANTWYYVLDPNERRAMVIEFENGVAREAQFIRGAKRS